MSLKVGDIVINCNGVEFEVVELRDDITYCILTKRVEDESEFTFTASGKFKIDRDSGLDLVIDEDGSIKVFNSTDDSIEPIEYLTVVEPKPEDVTITINGYMVCVGDTWLTRGGEKYTIRKVEFIKEIDFPIITTEGSTFSAQGAKYSIEAGADDLDVLDRPEYSKLDTIWTIGGVWNELKDTVCDEFVSEEEPTLEPVEELLTEKQEVFPVLYEKSLKTTKVELSTLITSLIKDDADINEIKTKLKVLKKLLEL